MRNRNEMRINNLFDCAEVYGNDNGTEAQMNLYADFIRTALGIMSPGQVSRFFADRDVMDVMALELAE